MADFLEGTDVSLPLSLSTSLVGAKKYHATLQEKKRIEENIGQNSLAAGCLQIE